MMMNKNMVYDDEHVLVHVLVHSDVCLRVLMFVCAFLSMCSFLP